MKHFLHLFLFLPSVIFSQDITGYWAGYISTNGSQLPYELVISKNENKFSGYSLTVFTIGGVENAGLKSMKIKTKKGKVIIEDSELIEDNYNMKAKRVMLWSDLTVSKKDTTLLMTGNFNSLAFNNPTYKGTIFLEKRKSFSGARLRPKLEEKNLLHTLSFLEHAPGQVKEGSDVVAINSTRGKKITTGKNKNRNDSGQGSNKEITVVPAKSTIQPKINLPAPAAADIAKRKIEPIQTIFYTADSLKLTLYDNGEIDGDTVSVIWNGVAVIAKEGLTTNAITRTIYMPPGGADSMQLVMYAENLGSIPPNTGLLIIQDGDKRYEIRFSGDLQRNSSIIFKPKR